MKQLSRLFKRAKPSDDGPQEPETQPTGCFITCTVQTSGDKGYREVLSLDRKLRGIDLFGRPRQDDMGYTIHRNVRLKENGLIDLTPPGDNIAAIECNRQKSPLLRLPPELRNCIFRLALGGDGGHIHVYDTALVPTSTATALPPSGPSNAADSSQAGHTQQLKSSPSRIGPLTNCTYADYKECFKKLESKSLQLLGIRGVLPWEAPQLGHARMTLIARTCRQLYDEVALLPYMLNVFSFSPGVVGTWMKRRIPAQKQVITTLFAEHLCCSSKVIRCLWGNASAQNALSRDSDVRQELFMGWTALKKIYVTRQVIASVYGRRCLCHGDLVDELEEDIQESIAKRICAQRVNDILWIVPGGIEVELLDW